MNEDEMSSIAAPRFFEDAVAGAARRGRRDWPGVEIPVDDFGAHCRQVRAGVDELDRHGGDLYLACACTRGDELAMRVLDRRLLPSIDPYVARLGLGSAGLDEVRQLVRVRLLTDRPRIATYSGRGPLTSWLRIVAVRVAFERDGAGGPGDVSDGGDAVGKLVASGVDPEQGLTLDRFREQFQRALDDSFVRLSPRAKTLLRMHYVDGLSIDAMGVIYRVHRATVARWLVAIRSTVMAGLRDKLTFTARPTSSDFRSLAAALRDELHISVERVLGEAGDQGARKSSPGSTVEPGGAKGNGLV
jgi:RNA polymerase sigma-70 factor (ECF subfamily)